MIVRPRPNAFSLLFILRGSILPMIAPRVLCVLAVSAAVVVWHHFVPASFSNVSAAPFTLLGLALSIFLGFRNNACYERWWEGRKQWGQLASETRNLTREFLVLPARRRGVAAPLRASARGFCPCAAQSIARRPSGRR